MRHAVVSSDHLVVNVIELTVDAKWSPPEGCAVVASETAAMGDSYDPMRRAFVRPKLVRTPDEIKLETNASIMARIAGLEALQHRPLREAVLGDRPAASGGGSAAARLKEIDDQIVALRTQIIK